MWQYFKRKKIKLTRDGALFLLGIIGIVHEVFFTSLDRPDVLILFMALVGLPAFLSSDEKFLGKKKDNKDNDQSDNSSDGEGNGPSSTTARKRPPADSGSNYDDIDEW